MSFFKMFFNPFMSALHALFFLYNDVKETKDRGFNKMAVQSGGVKPGPAPNIFLARFRG